MAHIPAVVPDVANMHDRQMYVGRPVRAVTASNLDDSENSLLMWRHLRVIPSVMVASAVPPEAAQTYTYRIRWVTSPTAQFAWVGFFPFAIEPAAGSAPNLEVAATLLTVPAGAVVDGPIYWRYSPPPAAGAGHGRLPLQPAPSAGALRSTFPIFAQTGWDATGLDLAYAGPRLLDLQGNTATDVEVELATLQCRIYSAVVIEAFTPEVT